MQKWLIIAIVLLTGIHFSAVAQGDYETKVRDYISTYKELAVKEQVRKGIPAAITLAQGIHETSAGASPLATDANNHFGIKCKKGWTGLTYSYTDDAPDECFRKYNQVEESYKDHSDYLATNPRYAPLFKCSATDYKGWATGLKRCGYATNPKYAQLLIKIIEDYNLQEYTYAAIDGKKNHIIAKEIVPEHDAPTPIAEKKDVLDASVIPPTYGVLLKVNGLKAVYAKKGDMPLEYAIKFNVRYERFLEYNEIDERPLASDMFLYLEKKAVKGTIPTYKVKAGETLSMIAQAQGIQSKSLRSLNMLKDREEPEPGAVLSLQKQATRKPKTAALAMNANVAEETPVADIPQAPAENFIETSAGTTNTVSEEVVAKEVPVEATPVIYDYGETSEPAIAVTTADIKEPVVEEIAVVNTSKLLPEPESQPEPVTKETVVVSEPVSKTVNLPAPDNTFISKTEIEEKAFSEIGPPVSVNDIPEKKIDKPQVAAVAEKPVEQAPPDRPKSQLDILKSKFDKVVYATPAPKTAAQPAAEIKTEPAPAAEPVLTATPQSRQIVIRGTARFYVVKKGDTAFSIAKAHGLTVSQLQEMNGLDFDAIKVGQKLRVKQ